MASVPVRNTRPGPAVYQSPDGSVVIEWQSAGDPNGEDIQAVPTDIAESAAFARSIRKGIFEVLSNDSPYLLESLDRQGIAQHRSRAAEEAFVDTYLEPSASGQDLVMMTCIISGQPVPQKVMDLHKLPPLAPEYAYRAPDFTPVPTGELMEDGTSVVKWVEVVIGEALPSQQ